MPLSDAGVAVGPALRSAAERLAGPRRGPVSLELRPVRSGMEADAVWDATARWSSPDGRRNGFRFFAKRLSGATRREALVYRWLSRLEVADLAPRLLDAVEDGPAVTLLLERIRPAVRWPWEQECAAADVLRAAARLHGRPQPEAAGLPLWGYDAELMRSAEATLEHLEASRRDPRIGLDAASLRAVRRVVLDLPAIRKALLSGPPGESAIHGDLHPGNVLLRASAGRTSPVLLDWGRARVGSPLEDVSSFLHTLGCWEPVAHARHDTLLGTYLAARGFARQPSQELRCRYWLAGVSNALAGALRFHATVATVGSTPRERHRGVLGARDWLRIIRRAAVLWAPVAPRAGAPRGAPYHRTTARDLPSHPTPQT